MSELSREFRGFAGPLGLRRGHGDHLAAVVAPNWASCLRGPKNCPRLCWRRERPTVCYVRYGSILGASPRMSIFGRKRPVGLRARPAKPGRCGAALLMALLAREGGQVPRRVSADCAYPLPDRPSKIGQSGRASPAHCSINRDSVCSMERSSSIFERIAEICIIAVSRTSALSRPVSR